MAFYYATGESCGSAPGFNYNFANLLGGGGGGGGGLASPRYPSSSSSLQVFYANRMTTAKERDRE